MRATKILVVLLAGLVLAGCQQQSVEPVTPPEIQTPEASAIARITVDDLWQRIQGGEEIVVVDVRSAADYNVSHLPAAVSIPETEFAARAGELSPDRLLVFYCA